MTDKLKVLGICASPRKGNSFYLLEEALEVAAGFGAATTEINRFHFGTKPFAPCDACGAHKGLGGECRIEDSFQELRDLWLGADVILYSFPIYHMGIPAQLKAFIDRLGNSLGYYFQPSEPKTFFIPRLMKAIGLITQGAHHYGGQDLALSYMLYHALLMRCFPVPGDMPESYLGAAGWTAGQGQKSSLRKRFEAGDEDARGSLAAVRGVARRAMETALILRAGLRESRPALQNDPDYAFVLNKIG